jgi:predicted Zn-dependent peptidase
MRAAALLLLAATLLAAHPAFAQQLAVIETNLPNGFTVLLAPRKGEPTIAGGWVVRAGSANERPGITGIAHFFEHMMFKGSPVLGTTNHAAEIAIMAEQERVRDAMRAEESALRAAWRRGEITEWQKPECWTPRYRELREEFRRLVDAHAALITKNEFDKAYTAGGASGMNAYTSTDMTCYYIQVPANKLELWAWMESERLLRPVFREFYAERDVVFEERRMRTESTPLGPFLETYESMLWKSHPYHWPTLGWPSDIPNISKADADAFFATYYQPRNITLILTGDFEPAAALEVLARYFGRIPASDRPIPDVATLEFKQPAEQRLNAEADTNPQVWISWQTVPAGHPDAYALEVLQHLLSGRTGRLHKALVLSNRVATDTFASNDARKWAGSFAVGGESAEGRTPAEVEAALYAEIDRLRTEPVPGPELQKVKNNLAAAEYRKLSGNLEILMQLLHATGLGRWQEINEAGAKLQAVTPDDIRRVVSTYFAKENRTAAVFTRKAGAPSADKLSQEEAAEIGAALTRIRSEKDPARVEKIAAQLAARAKDAPADKRAPFLRLQRAAEARLKELQSR